MLTAICNAITKENLPTGYRMGISLRQYGRTWAGIIPSGDLSSLLATD
jgi:hypothetical protein